VHQDNNSSSSSSSRTAEIGALVHGLCNVVLDQTEMSKKAALHLVPRSATVEVQLGFNQINLVWSLPYFSEEAHAQQQRYVEVETLPLAKAELELKCGGWAHVKLHAKAPLKPGSKSTMVL
jgi:hypothetical protein